MTPLARLLDEADCTQVVRAFAARAAELGQPVEHLLWSMAEFWLRVPETVDDRSLAVWAAQFSSMLEPGDYADHRLSYAPPAERMPLPRPGSRIRRGRKSGPADSHTSGCVPFTTVRQAADIYAAATALPQLWGETFTACLTLDHGPLGHSLEAEAVDMVGRLVKELTARTCRRRPDQEAGLHRVSFLGRTADGNLRSTALLALPEFLIEPTRDWLSGRLPPAAVGSGLPKKLPFNFDADCPRTARGRMNRHWELVRRLWMGVDPEAMVDGEYLFIRLGLLRRQLVPPGLISGRRFNLSQTITRAVQRQQELQGLPLLSAWKDRAWESLFSGWELAEHQDRQGEAARRAAQIAELEASYGKGGGALDRIALENRVRAARASWAWNARGRPHSWEGWWQSE